MNAKSFLLLVAQLTLISASTNLRNLKSSTSSVAGEAAGSIGGATTLQDGDVPCPAELNAFVQCAIDNGFTEALYDSCVQCVVAAEPAVQPCDDAFSFACRQPGECASCGVCAPYFSAYLNCAYAEQGCPDRSCTPAGTTAPPPTCPTGSLDGCVAQCFATCE